MKSCYPNGAARAQTARRNRRRSGGGGGGERWVGGDGCLPAHVLEVLLAEVGVEVVHKVAQVVQPAQPGRQLAAAHAGEQLLDGQAHHAAVGRVGVELRHPPRQRLKAPAAAGRSGAASDRPLASSSTLVRGLPDDAEFCRVVGLQLIIG